MRALTENEVKVLALASSASNLLLMRVAKRRFGWKGVGTVLLLQTHSDIGTFIALHRAGAINWEVIRKAVGPEAWREVKRTWHEAREKNRKERENVRAAYDRLAETFPADLRGRDLP